MIVIIVRESDIFPFRWDQNGSSQRPPHSLGSSIFSHFYSISAGYNLIPSIRDYESATLYC